MGVDEVTKERWITQMMAGYPLVDRLMCELCLDKWAEDPEYFEKVERGEIVVPPTIERNKEYVYKGVTIDPVPEFQESTTVE